MTDDSSAGSLATPSLPRPSLPRPSLLFKLTALPILLLGFRRPRVQGSVLADLVTFASPVGQIAFAALAALAVAYPIVASLAHANVSAFTSIRNGTDSFTFAIFPLFDVVYSESLPFMAAAAVLGLFSPALGALFVAVFVPADLWAANASGELFTTPTQPGGSALVARLISYLMLWLLAVEIPLQVRAVGDALGGWSRGAASTARVTAVRTVAAAVLVFIWARSLAWVIVPVFTWSGLQVVQNLAIRPTWWYWQALVGAAVVGASVAALWPGLPASRPAEPVAPTRPRRVPSLPEVLARQLVVVAGMALLSAGLLTTMLEAAILVLGLLLAGPGLTLVGPRIPLPPALTGTSGPVRWAIAMAVSLVVATTLLVVGGAGLYTDGYVGLMVVLAVTGVLFRVLLVGGSRAVVQEPALTGAAAATTGALSILLVVFMWLALPAIALADDCSDFSGAELPSCALWAAAAALMPPVAGFLAGSALANAMADKKPPPDQRVQQSGPFIPPPQYGPRTPSGPPPNPFGKTPSKAPPPQADEPGFFDKLLHF